MLQLEIYDWDRLSNDILGTVSLDIDQCVLSPGQWKINQNFKIEGVKEFIEKKFTYFGEIYVQAMFLEGAGVHDGKFPEVTENLKEVISRTAIKGKLEIKLIHGENLKVGDDNGKSDPFVIFTMPDKKEVESKRIENSLNPIWNQLIVHPLNIISSYVEPIQIKVMDYDFGSRNDFLGKTVVEIDELIRNPGKWLLNRIYDLEEEVTVPKDEASKVKGKMDRFICRGGSWSMVSPIILLHRNC
jgi:Ca2+-dependent lipid-binding protein